VPGVKYGARRAGLASSRRVVEEGLLPPDASWRDLWRAMPAYEMGSTEAFRKVTVHFRSAEEVEEFGRLLGFEATARTESVWFTPDEAYVAPKELLWTGGRGVPRHPIYVISKGRWETPLTAEALRAIGVAHRVVVEPSEAAAYARALGEERLLVAPEDFSSRGSGSIPVRNFVWEHAVASGAERHWILDDNIRGFLRLHRNRRIPVSDGSIFRAAEDFVDRYRNVALAGFNYMYLVGTPERKDNLSPFYLNTRVYSMILVDHAWTPEERRRGRYNEDTDLSLRALKDGWCTVLFNAFLGDKAPTLTMGGDNAGIYAESDERREFAESLREQHPDVATVVRRYDRWHHEVNYAPFAANALVEREGWAPPIDPEYGMRIERTAPRPSRYPTAPAAPVEPVRIVVPTRAALPDAAVIPPAPPDTAVTLPTTPTPPISLDVLAPARTPSPPRSIDPAPAPPSSTPVTLAPRSSRVAPTTLAPRAGPAKRGVVDGFLEANRATLDAAGSAPLRFDEATWDRESREAVGLDVEVYPNFFVACFRRFSDGKRIAFESSDRVPLDADGLRRELERNLVFTFNGTAYDLPICYLALKGASPAALRTASERIVGGTLRPWDVERQLGVRVPALNHVDLIEPNPSVRQGLKVLAGRLYAKYLVDLPFDPDRYLSPREMNLVTLYCFNDVDCLGLLREAMIPALELRFALGRDYGIDLRSKSDAQIGESILLRRVAALSGRRPNRPTDVAGRRFRYVPPAWARFATPAVAEVVGKLAATEISTDSDGKVVLPSFLDVVEVAGNRYAMGIGGLHSQEENRAVFADDGYAIEDVDVSSHYPRIILGLGLYPAELGPAFLTVYRQLFDERNDPVTGAKARERAATDPDERRTLRARSEGLKIVLNGSGFGKSASAYSPIYAPDMFAAITLTGQLSVLLLIERAEAAGIPVVSANTDGVVFRYPVSLRPELDAVLAGWERDTGYELERTPYRALYSASVNSYVAVKPDGKVKRKGPIADPWGEGDLRGMMSKNPQMTVCAEAAIRWLTDREPVERTIRGESDPRRFVTLIRVAEGGMWRGSKLGRAVRFYWSIDGDPIVYASSGRRVPKSDGAKPMMTLPDALPDDLDLARYVAEAERWIVELGVSTYGLGER
jgi:hypothetical protein